MQSSKIIAFNAALYNLGELNRIFDFLYNYLHFKQTNYYTRVIIFNFYPKVKTKNQSKLYMFLLILYSLLQIIIIILLLYYIIFLSLKYY